MGSKKPPPQFGHTPFHDLRLPPRPPAPAAEPAPAPAPKPAPAPPTAKPSAPREADLSADDLRAFDQAMRGVRPLDDAQRRQRAINTGQRPSPSADRAAQRRAAARDQALAEAELADLVDAATPFAIDHVGDAVSAVAPGIDRRLLRRLRAGDYPVEAEIDLHHRTRVQAQADVARFITDSVTQHHRCVLVIHGRGTRSGPDGPVLKSAVLEALTTGRLRRQVLALCSAPPDRGGDGALLVLLRRR